MYSSALSLNSAIDKGGGLTAAVPPGGKPRYPLYKRLGGPPGSVWTGAETLAPHQVRSTDRLAESPCRLR